MAQMVPHCLSSSLPHRQTSCYCMQFVNKLREKTFFQKFDNFFKKFLWECDKQFGTNGASLFIFEFASSANIVLLYVVLQKQNCLKKLFSEVETSCKKFLWEYVMVNISNFFTPLAKKSDFNMFVRHIQAVIDILDNCNPAESIADKINGMISAKAVKPEQVKSILSVSLFDRWNYKVVSENLKIVPEKAAALTEEIGKWNGIDIIFGYDHPDLGFLAINPKNPGAASVIQGFRKNELLLIYIGKQDKGEVSESLAKTVAAAILKLFEGKSASVPNEVKTGPFKYVEPKKAAPVRAKKAPVRKTVKRSVAQPVQTAQAPSAKAVSAPLERPSAVSTGPKKMSQLVSVPVSNELFHNGNVEAWKRIIRSYNAKYPSAEVMVFYDGERIVDINTLFKWGKVKHGSTIQFAVSAEEIMDLSKLSKYFRQGASPMFEAFLRGSPDTVLNLF